jgi:hypothetical protein
MMTALMAMTTTNSRPPKKPRAPWWLRVLAGL